MTEKIKDIVAYLSDRDAKLIREEHSDRYIAHYYKKARTHEKNGKMKGDFPYYFLKLLKQDKGKFYIKDKKNKELAQKEKERKRRAEIKPKSVSKNREKRDNLL